MSIHIETLEFGVCFSLNGLQGVIPFPLKYRTVQRLQRKPITEVQTGIIMECGDSFKTWLPVFTDWWET